MALRKAHAELAEVDMKFSLAQIEFIGAYTTFMMHDATLSLCRRAAKATSQRQNMDGERNVSIHTR